MTSYERIESLLVTLDRVTPSQFKSRGAGLTLRWGFAHTLFGRVLLALAPKGVCHLAFLHEGLDRAAALAELRERWPAARLENAPGAARAEAARIFRRGRRRLPVFLSGSPFQLRVWQALLEIPEGSTTTYAALAAAVGKPRAARAVGQAVGGNSIAWLIPCHRVLRGCGLLGGYRWGAERKRSLLEWEKRIV